MSVLVLAGHGCGRTVQGVPAAGVASISVARRVEWSPSKLLRFELSEVGISVSGLRPLLKVLGIRVRRLVEMLHDYG